jgi:hypothetical protein
MLRERRRGFTARITKRSKWFVLFLRSALKMVVKLLGNLTQRVSRRVFIARLIRKRE